MSRIIAILALLLANAVSLVSCAGPGPEPTPVPVETPTVLENTVVFEAEDGLRATMDEITLVSGEDGQCTLRFRVKNETDVALTRLRFGLNYLDAEGEPLRENPIPVTVSFLTDPLLPGEEREREVTRYFTGAERAASPVFDAPEADTEFEVPPWTEPQPDNLLLDFCNDDALRAQFAAMEAETPVTLIYSRDEEPDITVTDPETIAAVVAALQTVRIGDETDVMVTDSAFWYRFIMEDGSEFSIGFEFWDGFYWHGKTYEVLDMGDLSGIWLR